MMNKFSIQSNPSFLIKKAFLTKLLGIILIVSFTIFCANGQNFAPIGAKWHYTHDGWFPYTHFNLTESVKDTIIEEKKCRILNKTRAGCELRNSTEYIFEENNKVYYYDVHLAQFNLLYDFNLIRGDTLKMVAVAGYTESDKMSDTLLFRIDSTRNTTINGVDLKRQYVTTIVNDSNFSSCFFPIGGFITEKLGHNKRLFPWYFGVCDGSIDNGLRCYEDSEIGHYETGIAESCTFSTGLEEIEKNKIKIFPNPVQNKLVIDFKQQPSKTEDILIKIFDITGKLVLQTGFHQNIDVAFLQQGAYFLHLFDLEGKRLSYKFLKL